MTIQTHLKEKKSDKYSLLVSNDRPPMLLESAGAPEEPRSFMLSF